MPLFRLDQIGAVRHRFSLVLAELPLVCNGQFHSGPFDRWRPATDSRQLDPPVDDPGQVAAGAAHASSSVISHRDRRRQHGAAHCTGTTLGRPSSDAATRPPFAPSLRLALGFTLITPNPAVWGLFRTHFRQVGSNGNWIEIPLSQANRRHAQVLAEGTDGSPPQAYSRPSPKCLAITSGNAGANERENNVAVSCVFCPLCLEPYA